MFPRIVQVNIIILIYQILPAFFELILFWCQTFISLYLKYTYFFNVSFSIIIFVIFIIKNYLLVRERHEKRMEAYKRWCDLRERTSVYPVPRGPFNKFISWGNYKRRELNRRKLLRLSRKDPKNYYVVSYNLPDPFYKKDPWNVFWENYKKADSFSKKLLNFYDQNYTEFILYKEAIDHLRYQYTFLEKLKHEYTFLEKLGYIIGFDFNDKIWYEYTEDENILNSYLEESRIKIYYSNSIGTLCQQKDINALEDKLDYLEKFKVFGDSLKNIKTLEEEFGRNLLILNEYLSELGKVDEKGGVFEGIYINMKEKIILVEKDYSKLNKEISSVEKDYIRIRHKFLRDLKKNIDNK